MENETRSFFSCIIFNKSNNMCKPNSGRGIRGAVNNSRVGVETYLYVSFLLDDKRRGESRHMLVCVSQNQVTTGSNLEFPVVSSFEILECPSFISGTFPIS